jgi:mannose-6-phosphate isomerase-like protein (cupin superfamily)
MTTATERQPIVLAPGEGREYPMGQLSVVFKADGHETDGSYSISEWWLDPHTKGTGAHQHPGDDVFFVLEGAMHFLVDDEWVEAPVGSFVLAPGGVTHSFENRGGARAGAINISVPDLEERIPGIADWFINRAPGDTIC